MPLRREVLIRIIALLQGKKLIETKSGTLKCLKRHYSDYSTVRSMKNVAVLTRHEYCLLCCFDKRSKVFNLLVTTGEFSLETPFEMLIVSIFFSLKKNIFFFY